MRDRDVISMIRFMSLSGLVPSAPDDTRMQRQARKLTMSSSLAADRIGHLGVDFDRARGTICHPSVP